MRPRGRALWSLTGLLRAVTGRGAVECMRERPCDWAHLLSLANEHLVTPSLHALVARHRDRIPTDVQDYLQHLHVMNRRRNRAIRRQALEIVRALNACGIEPLMLKGVLSILVDGGAHAGGRMMADIDLAVPRLARSDVVAAMERLGYRIERVFPAGHHAIGEFVRVGDPAAVDLHIELTDQAYLLPADEVWANARRVRIAMGTVCRVPHATHRVLHNILHAQVHFRGGFYLAELDLRQLMDLVFLAEHYSADVDWRSIERRLRTFRLETALYSYLENARLLFALPWPLEQSASTRARLHAWRCRAQQGVPALRILMVPWGNLRAAFASHRMAALYGGEVCHSAGKRWRHVRRLIGRHSALFVLNRLFRA